MSKWNKAWVVVGLVLSQTVFASANFNVTPSGTLPTSIFPGQTVTALYTVTNKTTTSRNGYLIQGLPSTVTQGFDVGTCTKPLNLAAHASCLLELKITAPVSSGFAVCKGSSCTTSAVPLNVHRSSENTVAKYAYTANSDFGVTVCPVLDTGLVDDTNCVDAGGNLFSDNVEALGVVISADNTHAYVNSATPSDRVYSCTINPADGTFTGACTPTIITTPTGYEGYYGQITLNHSNTYAFIATYNSDVASYGVISCPISGGIISGNCTQQITGLSYVPVGVSVNAADDTFYMGGYDDGSLFRVCSLSGPTISGCINKIGGGSINFSISAVKAILNPAGTILYVGDYGDTKIYACDPAYNATPYFDNCVDTGYAGNDVWGFTINKLGTMLYTVPFSTTGSACPIQNDGSVGACTSFTVPHTAEDVALGY